MKQTVKIQHTACCSRRQKIWGVIALVGLFACGWMVGASVNKWRADMNTSDTGDAEVSQPVAAPAAPRECEVIEDYIKHELDVTTDDEEYTSLYRLLLDYACPENRDGYLAQAQMRRRVEEAKYYARQNQQKQLCTRIEEELLSKLLKEGQATPEYLHENNAIIYANIADRGCPQNKDKYTELARQELELMRAITNDELSENEALTAARTYKRLQMQAAAEDVLDKVKKLTNPAIDFIMEMERIINE